MTATLPWTSTVIALITLNQSSYLYLFYVLQEDSDLDTADLCSRRIKRIVACDAVRFLVKFLSAGSAQTREAAARALRQMCVEVSVRGAIIQQGGLKACCTAACDDDNKVCVLEEYSMSMSMWIL